MPLFFFIFFIQMSLLTGFWFALILDSEHLEDILPGQSGRPYRKGRKKLVSMRKRRKKISIVVEVRFISVQLTTQNISNYFICFHSYGFSF